MAVRKKSAEETTAKAKQEKTSYTKKQLLMAERYKNRRDLLEALLEEGKSYTMEEVDKLMSDFMKGKVN